MRNNRNRKPRRDDSSRRNESLENVIPSSEILEKFEDAVPGSVAEIIEMAAKEQKHRHSWQDNYLKTHTITTRLGQFCALAYNIVLLGLVYKLINSGEKDLALKLFTINAALISFVVIITTFERRVFSRRPRNSRPRDDRRVHGKKRTPEKK